MKLIFKKTLLALFFVIVFTAPFQAGAQAAEKYQDDSYGSGNYQEPTKPQDSDGGGSGDNIAPVATLNAISGKGYNLEPHVLVSTNWPTFSGVSTEPGTVTLKITKRNNILPYVDITHQTSGSEDSWNFEMPYALLDGAYTVLISAKDEAGNNQEFPLNFLLTVSTGVTGKLNLTIIESQGVEEPGQQTAIEETVFEESKESGTVVSPIPPPDAQEEEIGGNVSLQVKVVDGASRAVNGAKVTLFSDPIERVSDSDGIAHFESVPRGVHRLSIVSNGLVGEREISLENEQIEEFRITVEIKPRAWYEPLYVKILISLIVIISVIFFIMVFLLSKKRSQSEENEQNPAWAIR